jgi:hypothetical protein
MTNLLYIKLGDALIAFIKQFVWEVKDLESRSVSIAWKIMMIPDFAALLFGLVFTFVPDVMNSQGFESFTGQSWSAFVSANPKIADLLLLTSGRMFGTHILVMALLFFAVTLYGFRKGQGWSWYTLLIGFTLGWVPDAVAVGIIGMMPLVIGSIVFLLIAYIALGISAKDILGKK